MADREKTQRRCSFGTKSKSPGVIIFSTSLTRRLATAQARLPPNYIGVRRIRPSSRVVRKALRKQASSSAMSSLSDVDETTTTTTTIARRRNPVTYKIVDEKSGVERRMTTQEKKQFKYNARQERKRQKQEEREGQMMSSSEKQPQNAETLNNVVSEGIIMQKTTEEEQEQDDDRYMQLDIDYASLKEELADIRGERNGVPPVVLSPPLARQAFLQGEMILPLAADSSQTSSSSTTSSTAAEEELRVVVDDNLASEWATILRQSMAPAEEVRRHEKLRSLPYVLKPEVWNRMRPPLQGNANKQMKIKNNETMVAASSVDASGERAWSFCHIQPFLAESSIEADSEAVIQLLHQGTNLHISCGAKFGCDYLLYDGPRGERHSFAGLRVLSYDDAQGFPVPTAYDMAAYARTLNTAKKLALFATVVREGTLNRVAIVDLALEKVTATTHRRTGIKTPQQLEEKKSR